MSSVQLLDGAYLSNLKKNGKWSLGLLLFSPKASFPKAGPSKADQFPKIHETEDRGAAGEGAGRGWCLERKGALGGPPPERASAGGSCGGSPGHYALPQVCLQAPSPTQLTSSGN